MSTTREGDRRLAMSYFRYASLVTDELAAETESVAGSLSPAAEAGAVEREMESVGEAADAAGLTTALWRAAHALAPAAALAEPAAELAGPYAVTSVREPTSPGGGVGHLDRLG